MSRRWRMDGGDYHINDLSSAVGALMVFLLAKGDHLFACNKNNGRPFCNCGWEEAERVTRYLKSLR